MQRLRDDGMKLSDAELTLLTPSYTHVVLLCSCGSPMLTTFSHAYAVVLCEREGMTSVYRVKTMIRGRYYRIRIQGDVKRLNQR